MASTGLWRRGVLPLIGVVAWVSAARAQVYSRQPNVVIPDWPTITDQMVVSGGPASITDLNVILDISHPDLSQLDILLIPPGGQQYLVLAADTASTEGLFDHTRFDDEACQPVYAGTGNFHATYRPKGGIIIPYLGNLAVPPSWVGSLGAFNGTGADGTWKLLIDDDTSGTTGVLHSWSLEFNGALDPLGPQDLSELCTSGSAQPSVVRAGVTSTLLVHVSPRSNPPSTGLSVFAQPGPLFPAAQRLYDDGQHSDGAAGDGVFGRVFTVPTGVQPGLVAVAFTAQDVQGRTGTGTIMMDVAPPGAWFESFDGGGDAGDMPATAQVLGAGAPTQIRGSLDTPTDVDMYAVSVCQPTQFRVSTEHVTSYDTQLFVFTPDGYGVVMNDDAFASYQSTITSAYLIQPGDYMLAIARYDNDPVDAGWSEIWDDANYIFEQQPDGPGAGNPVASWFGITFNPVGPYTITVQGVGAPGACSPGQCDSIDFNNDGLFPDTFDVDDMLSVFGGGPCSNDPNCGDIDFNNDGLFPDVNDINIFLQVFSGGPCQ